LGVIGFARTAEAQVGIQSGVAQVSLIARSLPQGSLQAVAGEGTLNLRVSANKGYSLVVRGASQTTGSRTWVRSVNGEFQEVTPGSSVTVVRDQDGTVDVQQTIEYRVESATAGEQDRLPFTYELHIAPTI
jgi:hypothetical protein